VLFSLKRYWDIGTLIGIAGICILSYWFFVAKDAVRPELLNNAQDFYSAVSNDALGRGISDDDMSKYAKVMSYQHSTDLDKHEKQIVQATQQVYESYEDYLLTIKTRPDDKVAGQLALYSSLSKLSAALR
jgi:hypothetical protein